MGTYATTTSLDIVMVGVSFDTVTAALASKLIDQAQAEIDGSLSRRYDLGSDYFQTSTSTPPQVRSWTERLSEGFMWQSLARGGAGKESMARGKGLIDAVRLELKDMREYKSELLDTLGSVIVDMSQTAFRVLCNTTDYTPTFNEDDELSQRVDPDKLEAIRSERE